MRRRAILLLGVLLLFTAVQTTALTAQPPPRLIADNRTPYVVDLWAWNGASWNFVSRLAPATWQAFPNAAPGSYWRAVFGQAVRDHQVYYVFDPGYGGYQDVWWVQ